MSQTDHGCQYTNVYLLLIVETIEGVFLFSCHSLKCPQVEFDPSGKPCRLVRTSPWILVMEVHIHCTYKKDQQLCRYQHVILWIHMCSRLRITYVDVKMCTLLGAFRSDKHSSGHSLVKFIRDTLVTSRIQTRSTMTSRLLLSYMKYRI